MSIPGLLQVGVFVVVLLLITKPVGLHLWHVFSGQRTFLTPVLGRLEGAIYRVTGVRPEVEQGWKGYAFAMLLFSVVGALLTYAILRLQSFLPFNPQGLDSVSPDLAFNTAVSFTTNTNWQSYTPETTMSYFSQMAGLAFHNWVSAATGIAIAVALVRGLTRRSARSIGNFWVDLVRCTLYVLLPICFFYTFFLIWQGVPQNLSDYTTATTLESGTQTIAQGPVASQEAIKMLGTNGGGFFNANSAHPFENPTPLSNFLQMLSIFTIGSGLTYMFGKFAGDTRQGWAIWGAMLLLFLAGVAVVLPVEQNGNPLLSQLGVDQALSNLQTGGNFEGKEMRFGQSATALFVVITTDASCGAVNAMHDSLMPIAGMIPMLNIQLGEIIFGGVGAGLYGMLMFAIIAVFIAGLMVGRTPEFLGKKIESFEMKMAMLAALILAADILLFTAASSVGDWGTAATNNPGPHGFSEILYAFTSATGNNGSAFAGLGANTPYYNTTLGLAMLIGRFLMIVPLLAIAGSMVRKKRVPTSLGTFPTYGALWSGLLIGTILIVGALTYFPALALGPIVEQLLLNGGRILS
ncbi:MAG: potassium-transporting ATPase subunit KdpA [Chloroflexi bacterium]|nr:potassium-transporting ATPase subunit KdpA [Chloroflexota bacterium]